MPSPDDVLRLRAAGMTYQQIADEAGFPTASAAAAATRKALKASKTLLARQSGELATLELERLDALERRVQTTMAVAASAKDHEWVLAAAERLIQISAARTALIAANRAPGTIEAAVRRELALLSPKVRDGAQAHAALLLAVALDGGMPPRDAAAVSRELRVSMATLAAVSPERAEGDPVDEFTAKREARLAADR